MTADGAVGAGRGGILVLIILIFTGMPIGAALFATGAGGLSLIFGFEKASVILFGMSCETASNYSLVVAPMFILMGLVASDAGLKRDMFNSANAWLSRIRGSLLISTVRLPPGSPRSWAAPWSTPPSSRASPIRR